MRRPKPESARGEKVARQPSADGCGIHKVSTAIGLASLLLLYPGASVCVVTEGIDHQGDLEVYKNDSTLAYITLTGISAPRTGGGS